MRQLVQRLGCIELMTNCRIQDRFLLHLILIDNQLTELLHLEVLSILLILGLILAITLISKSIIIDGLS